MAQNVTTGSWDKFRAIEQDMSCLVILFVNEIHGVKCKNNFGFCNNKMCSTDQNKTFM